MTPLSLALPDVSGPYVDTGIRSDDRAAWLEVRRTGIGASEAAALVGETRWSEPAKVYAIKVGLEVEEDGVERYEWGLRHEPAILAAYSSARYADRPAVRDGRLLRSNTHPWMLCTLDGWTLVDGEWIPLEIKTTDSRNGDAWDEGAVRPDGRGIEPVPTEYYWQLQWQMHVTGAKRASIACLLGPHRLAWADVDRDEVAIRRLVRAGEDLWDRVRKHGTDAECPPPSRDPAMLRMLYPREDGRTVELVGGFVDLDHERERLSKKRHEIEVRLREIDAAIQSEMRNAERAVLPGGASYTWKTVHFREQPARPASERRTFRRHAPPRKG